MYHRLVPGTADVPLLYVLGLAGTFTCWKLSVFRAPQHNTLYAFRILVFSVVLDTELLYPQSAGFPTAALDLPTVIPVLSFLSAGWLGFLIFFLSPSLFGSW